MIICLSHSGTNEDSSKSEDEELARKVPDIDVIISGHTHTKLEDYIKEGDTYIVSCGNYGESLGELRLKKSGDRWKAEKYQLNALTDDVKEDPEITEMLGQYKKLVDEEYLSQFGYTFDQVLAENPVSFTQMDDFGKRVEEDTLGSLLIFMRLQKQKEKTMNLWRQPMRRPVPFVTRFRKGRSPYRMHLMSVHWEWEQMEWQAIRWSVYI